ncbi:Redoxin [Penicillium robsamsonii]|uniref:Redoxin n=1 Tax=Penicillium robsamsonii TaxID=1792511 RepID=UPI0025480E19|nr:Redoxin [Penicillium robsamsonii]KAJ5824753.1 Redoxin [Penicillium robsamsonii]
MTTLKSGDSFPSDVVFKYIPWSEESDEITSCGIPINYNASQEWANKKVVLFSVPGAFTPTCSVNHVPGYIQNLPKLREKGVDIVAVIAFNDPFVMSAWGKANKVRGDDIVSITPLSTLRATGVDFGEQLFLSDPDAKFSKSIGWADAASGRTARYAIVIDHGKVRYADIETERGAVKKSGADAVLASL